MRCVRPDFTTSSNSAAFALERRRELLERGQKIVRELAERREVHGGREHVVRRLAHVHVVVRVDVVAGERRDDLVRVHVRARPRAGLEDVDRELVVELAGRDAVSRSGDAVCEVAIEQPEVGVHARGGGLDPPEPARDRRRDRLSGDREVPDRLLRLAAPETSRRTVSATSASLAPPRQTAPMDVARSAQALLEPRRHLSEHRVVRASADARLGRAAGGARGLARRTDELGALGRPRRGGARVVRAARRSSRRDGRDRSQRLDAARRWSRRRSPDGSRVLAPDIEFTSVLFPFMAQEHRGVSVGSSRRPSSPARSGRTSTSSRSAPCRWRPARSPTSTRSRPPPHEHDVDDRGRRDAGRGLAPVRRGAVRRRRRPRLQVDAVAARHGVHGDPARAPRRRSFRTPPAGTPARIRSRRSSARRSASPTSARRLDTSPAWFMWVATAPALATIEEIGVDAIHEHDVGLANRFRAGLGLEPGQLGDRVLRHRGRCGEARARRDPRCRPRREAADVVARLQHDRRRRADARRALGLSGPPREARPRSQA